MADLWYYTKDGRQQEPVSAVELKRLATAGTLTSTDLVWKEGMAEWAQAGTVKGLFPSAAAGSAYGFAPASRTEPRPVPEDRERLPRSRSRSDAAEDDELDDRPRRKRPAEDDDDELDDRPRRRRRRDDDEDDDDFRPRRRRRHAGMSAGAKAAIIGGAVVLGLVVIVGIVIFALSGGGATRSFSLNSNEKTHFNLRFTKGKTVEIWVRSNGNSDVDLFVFDATGREVAKDDGFDKDCYVRFTPASTQTYKVEVWNRMLEARDVRGRMEVKLRNGPNSGTLTFQESDAGAAVGNAPPANIVPPVNAPPANVPPVHMPPANPPPAFGNAKEIFRVQNQLALSDPPDKVMRHSRCKTFTVTLTAGMQYQIDMVRPPGTPLDPYLRLEDSNGRHLAIDDDSGGNLNARIIFRATQTGNYRIVATALNSRLGPFTLTVLQQ
jgi:hypothetical protein